MTSYHVSIGYNRGRFYKYGEQYEFNVLKEMVRIICDNPKRIVEEARRLGSPETCENGCCHLDTYADNYKGEIGCEGHPLGYYTDMNGNEYLMQMASVDDEIKYCVRRAFIRILMEEMHRKGIEINIIVV